METEDETWTARPSASLLDHLHRRSRTESVRWIACLTLPHGTPERSQIRVALGDPIPHSHDHAHNLYLPFWLLDHYGFEGQGESVRIDFEPCETFAKAREIHLKVLDSVSQDLDLQEILEEPLSQLGILEEGMQIPCPVYEGVRLEVTKLEPSGVPIFLDGSDIALHIEQERPPTPIPPPIPRLQDPSVIQDLSGQTSMIPQETLAPPHSTHRSRNRESFIPFLCGGNRLGTR